MEDFKKYLGVKFSKDSKTAIFPKSWITKESKNLNCFWPHIKNLKDLGYKSFTLQSDQKDTITKICELAAERFKFGDGKLAHSIKTRFTAPYSSN